MGPPPPGATRELGVLAMQLSPIGIRLGGQVVNTAETRVCTQPRRKLSEKSLRCPGGRVGARKNLAEIRSSPAPMSEGFSGSCDVASRNPLIHNGATNGTYSLRFDAEGGHHAVFECLSLYLMGCLLPRTSQNSPSTHLGE